MLEPQLSQAWEMNCVIKWKSLTGGGGQVSKPGEDGAKMEAFRWNRV